MEEVIEAIRQRNVPSYKEFVFCGYGEPLMRASDVVEICRRLKQEYATPIRINTNGQAHLICGRDITPELKGLVDAVSISLNAKNPQKYQKICQSIYGEKSFAALLDFAVKCKRYVPKVIFSIVDVIEPEDIQACREIARQVGIDLRIRRFGN